MNKIIKVDKMMCGHCESSVKKALLELNGVKEVLVDLKKKRVEIIFDNKELSDEVIFNKVEDAGYTASNYEEKKKRLNIFKR